MMDESDMTYFHWWPGRSFRGDCPIPEPFVRECQRRGTRYLTAARLTCGGRTVWGLAMCCPKDVPSREIGRRIARGRAVKAFEYRSETT